MINIDFKTFLKYAGIVVACLVAVLEVLNGSVSPMILKITVRNGIGNIRMMAKIKQGV